MDNKYFEEATSPHYICRSQVNGLQVNTEVLFCVAALHPPSPTPLQTTFSSTQNSSRKHHSSASMLLISNRLLFIFSNFKKCEELSYSNAYFVLDCLKSNVFLLIRGEQANSESHPQDQVCIRHFILTCYAFFLFPCLECI